MLMVMSAAIAFVGTHFLLSHPLRAPLVARVGEKGFLGLYSLVAFATLGCRDLVVFLSPDLRLLFRSCHAMAGRALAPRPPFFFFFFFPRRRAPRFFPAWLVGAGPFAGAAARAIAGPPSIS